MLKTLKRNQHIFLALGAGIALGILNHFVSLTMFIKLVIAGMISVLIFWRPEVGVFMVSGLIPLLPTQYLMVLSALSFVSMAVRSFLRKEPLFQFSTLNLFSMLFAGNVVYGVLISFNRGESVYGAMIYLVYIVFYFTMQKNLTSKNLIYITMTLMVTAGFAVSALGIFQYITGLDTTALWIDQTLFGGIETRVYGTLGNPNVFGNYLQVLIPFAIFLFIVNKDRLARIYFASASVFMLASLIFTYSRSSWMGLLASLVIFALLRPRQLLPFATGGVIAAPLIVSFVPSVLDRLKGIGSLVDSSTRYRISVWIGSLGIIKDFWPCGIGMGFENFNRMLSNYAGSDIVAIHSHNTFLQVTVETGIMGFLLFLSLLIFYIHTCLSVYKTSKNYFIKTLAAALLSSMGGYVLICFFDNTLYDHSLKLVFWTMLGLCASLGRLSIQYTGGELKS